MFDCYFLIVGVYTINYNVLSWINYGGGEVKMMVFHNGVEIPETEIYSYSDGHAHDMASRTTVADFVSSKIKASLRSSSLPLETLLSSS